jgi:hypothetical protein
MWLSLTPQNRLLVGFSEPQLVQRTGLPGKISDPPLAYHQAPWRDQQAARERFRNTSLAV